MKKGIHPKYKETMITCACGEVIQTRATKQNMKIDICSKCHPFFTGKQKLVDSAGRVDRFKKKYGKTQQMKDAKKSAQVQKGKEGETPEAEAPQG
ncbi:MAG: 50S ribosomal protein L31 [Candidatus Omnitrophica bacterium]|nr:50S ribosomal protein L31 [Candidatus Omnitrophota bacterium]